MSLCRVVVKIGPFRRLYWKWIDLISCKEFEILRLYLSGRLELYNTKKIHLGFKWGIVITWIAGKSQKDRDNLICLLDLLFRTAWHQEIMSVCQGLQQVWILIIWWGCFQYFLVILVVSFCWDQLFLAWNCCSFAIENCSNYFWWKLEVIIFLSGLSKCMGNQQCWQLPNKF